jgi:hypothetical protein
MDLEPNALFIGGISLMAFTFGFVQFLKELFNLEGKVATTVSLLTGALVMGLYQALPYIPEPYRTIITIFFVSLAFGMSVSGYYKFATRHG